MILALLTNHRTTLHFLTPSLLSICKVLDAFGGALAVNPLTASTPLASALTIPLFGVVLVAAPAPIYFQPISVSLRASLLSLSLSLSLYLWVDNCCVGLPCLPFMLTGGWSRSVCCWP